MLADPNLYVPIVNPSKRARRVTKLELPTRYKAAPASYLPAWLR